jgi:hypothetical protein
MKIENYKEEVTQDMEKLGRKNQTETQNSWNPLQLTRRSGRQTHRTQR